MWTWVDSLRFYLWSAVTDQIQNFCWLANLNTYKCTYQTNVNLSTWTVLFHGLIWSICVFSFFFLIILPIALSIWSVFQRPAFGFNIFIYCFFPFLWASLVAQMVKRLPAMRETRVGFLGWEDPLEKEMAIHSSTLAWKIQWTEKPDRLQSMGSQRVGHDWATSPFI